MAAKAHRSHLWLPCMDLHLSSFSFHLSYLCGSLFLMVFKRYEHVTRTDAPDEAKLGRLRDYNVDLIPKFIMANGMRLLA
jgi:hypothetical protein